MSSNIIPSNFEEWRHCIEVDCGIKITESFVEQRIKALQDPNNEHTRQFVKSYSAKHHQNVLAWFKQAKEAFK